MRISPAEPSFPVELATFLNDKGETLFSLRLNHYLSGIKRFVPQEELPFSFGVNIQSCNWELGRCSIMCYDIDIYKRLKAARYRPILEYLKLQPEYPNVVNNRKRSISIDKRTDRIIERMNRISEEDRKNRQKFHENHLL